MPLTVFILIVVLSLISPQAFLKTTTSLNNGILAVFSNVFAWAAFSFLLTCVWAAFSPLGKIKIGGAEAEPLLSRWNWVAITLTTTIAVGILFWATAHKRFNRAAYTKTRGGWFGRHSFIGIAIWFICEFGLRNNVYIRRNCAANASHNRASHVGGCRNFDCGSIFYLVG